MAYVTDEQLKGYLDTNQLHREQMCLSILALDKRFTNVRPRHPRGGLGLLGKRAFWRKTRSAQ